MSTADLFFPPDEVQPFVDDALQDDSLTTFGSDDANYGICPYISFYLYHDKNESIDVAKKVIDICEEFEKIIDEPFQKKFKSATQVWLGSNDSRLPKDQLAEAEAAFKKEQDFWFGATELKSTESSPLWSMSGIVNYWPYAPYTIVKFVFRHKWYNQNKAQWHDFISSCVERLQPEQCYSGFEINSGPLAVMGNYEAETMERTLADHFYGLDIDHHLKFGCHSHENEDGIELPTELGAGIRTPTWCFMLSPFWLNKLGKSETEIRSELNDPRITITTIPYPKNTHNPNGVHGLWIQLGELDLHPVGKGKPELLVKANRLIQSIRCDQLQLTSFDAWEDDPNPRFDYFSGVKWMQRFDDESNWLLERVKNSPLPKGVYEAKPGETVPKGGTWYAPNLPEGGERYLEMGQQLPYDETNEEGDEVIWYRKLDNDQ